MTEREHDVATLCEEVRIGDLKAFGAFYSRYEGAVYRTALALVRDTMTAEDVVTDTFLRAHAARERLHPDGVAGWTPARELRSPTPRRPVVSL